jgi:hypothetical protein
MLPEYVTRVEGDSQDNPVRSFPNCVENTVVHEQNLDTWEFGKGALSKLRFCGVAVQQCCGWKRGRGSRQRGEWRMKN